MRKFCYIIVFAVAICCCNRPQPEAPIADIQPETHIADLFRNAQYGGGVPRLNGLGDSGRYITLIHLPFFETATPQVSLCGFDSILTILCNDYGQPTYNHNTLPKELIPPIDTGTYWMACKSYNQVYYWCSDTLNVSFGLFEKELINGKGWTYLYFKRPKSNGETKRWGEG